MTHRSVVIAEMSASPICVMCAGKGRMGLVGLNGIRATGTVRCPNCNAEPGHFPVPIYLYPLRLDHPRGESA